MVTCTWPGLTWLGLTTHPLVEQESESEATQKANANAAFSEPATEIRKQDSFHFGSAAFATDFQDGAAQPSAQLDAFGASETSSSQDPSKSPADASFFEDAAFQNGKLRAQYVESASASVCGEIPP